jgi:hypothetical protein
MVLTFQASPTKQYTVSYYYLLHGYKFLQQNWYATDLPDEVL